MSAGDDGQHSSPLACADFAVFTLTGRGIDLLLEMVLSLAFAISFLKSPHGVYVVCPLIELVFAGIIFWVYLNRYDQTPASLNWGWTDVFRCVGATIIYLVIAILCGSAGNTVGVILALLAMLVFSHNLLLLRPICCPQRSQSDDPPAFNLNPGMWDPGTSALRCYPTGLDVIGMTSP